MNNNFTIVSLLVILTVCITLSSNIGLNIEGQKENFNNITTNKSDISNVENFETYENSKYGIKIDYPSNWLKTEPGSTIGIEPYKQINRLNLASLK
ncbi:MAG: PsbP-related protein [Nitrososphaeraceae archaeon]